MCLAILCYNITHPGTILQGPEAQLPTIRSLVFKKRRARKAQVGLSVEDGEELAGKYVELEGKDSREGRKSYRAKWGLW
jgi:hypothetical protein